MEVRLDPARRFHVTLLRREGAACLLEPSSVLSTLSGLGIHINDDKTSPGDLVDSREVRRCYRAPGLGVVWPTSIESPSRRES